MAVPSFTYYGNHPRIWFRDTDKATLQARVANALGWKSIWDSIYVPYANSVANNSASWWQSQSSPDGSLMALATAGYLEEDSGLLDDAAQATVWLSEISPSSSSRRRNYMGALATGYDICIDRFTSSQKSAIESRMKSEGDKLGRGVPSELMTGHSGLDQACRMLSLVAMKGETSGVDSRLTQSLEFWFGNGRSPDESGGTGDGRISQMRYMTGGNPPVADAFQGGSELGSHYTFRNVWWEFSWLFEALRNGTSYNPWQDAANLSFAKIWRWLFWSHRGGADRHWESHGDTTRITAPRFNDHYRWAFGHLSARYTGTQMGHSQAPAICRWMYERMDAVQSDSGKTYAWDPVIFDKAALTPVAPKDASPALESYRMFAPPGTFYFRQAAAAANDWDFELSSHVRINAKRWYFLEHNHLDSGAIAISHKGDPLLLASAGRYDSFTSPHSINCDKRGWCQSMTPLIIDPSQSYQHYSVGVANDGGPHFKKYETGLDTRSVSRPYYARWMREDAGGLAWSRCSRFQLKQEDANGLYLSADLRDGYKKRHTDSHRCPILEEKVLIIRPNGTNGLNFPAILYYARIKKANENWRALIPFHHVRDPSLTSYGWNVAGFYQDGRIYVDVRDKANFTITKHSRGSPISNGWYSDQWRILGAGTNYAPGGGAASTHTPSIKEYSMYVEKSAKEEEERYVALLLWDDDGAGEPVPTRRWLTNSESPDYYGVELENSEVYRIHRTQDLAVFPLGGGGGETPDTTPPAAPTALVLEPRDRALGVDWTDPADSDLDHVDVYYRQKLTGPVPQTVTPGIASASAGALAPSASAGSESGPMVEYLEVDSVVIEDWAFSGTATDALDAVNSDDDAKYVRTTEYLASQRYRFKAPTTMLEGDVVDNVQSEVRFYRDGGGGNVQNSIYIPGESSLIQIPCPTAFTTILTTAHTHPGGGNWTKAELDAQLEARIRTLNEDLHDMSRFRIRVDFTRP